jgi:hypothetical protein
LSRIGYTTSSAICDIIDNSVRAKANNIHVLIKKEREDYSDTKRNNVSEYLIIDDGHGMSYDQIKDSLKLGSSEKYYEANSLSKFGLGLKSASFSQGDILEIISSDGSGFNKLSISLLEVMKAKKYFAKTVDITKEEKELINQYLGGNKGTIVRIGKIRKNNHPSVKKTISSLTTKVGVVYYYFLKEGLSIKVKDINIEAIDPLFVDEANENGNLNEFEWEGADVQWLERRRELTLDDDEGVKIEIEITQLPYPPKFKLNKKGGDAEIRNKYLIEANNYGFYVYRNKRLISWANRLDIVPYDQDYYSFRGRIFIDDSADDFFNIDVKKSSLTLSEEAYNVLSDFTKESRDKSKAAWKQAGRHLKNIINEDTSEIANKIVNDFEQVEILPGDIPLNESQALDRAKKIEEDMKSKVKSLAKMAKEDKGEEVSNDYEPSEVEKENAIKGDENPNINKIFRVSSVLDNLLYEPYYDSTLGVCVRINKLHRFSRLIYEDNEKNQDLQVIYDLFLLQLAEAEMYSYRAIDYDYDEVKKIMIEFRRFASEYLANMTRRLEKDLPPNYSGRGDD